MNEQVLNNTRKYNSMFLNQQYEVVKYINIRNLGKKIVQFVLQSVRVSLSRVEVNLTEGERRVW